MKNNIKLKLLLVIFTTSLLFSCAPKSNNIDFDFTTLKKSKKIKINNKENKDRDTISNNENNILFKDLIPLRDKEEILSKTTFGKKDPFSEVEVETNKLNSD